MTEFLSNYGEALWIIKWHLIVFVAMVWVAAKTVEWVERGKPGVDK